MTLAETWPMGRPRSWHLPRPLLVGTWPVLGGAAVASVSVLVELLAARSGWAGLARAPRLVAERLLQLPLAPHSIPLLLGGAPLLVFVGVMAGAVMAGRRIGAESPNRSAVLRAGLATLPALALALLLSPMASAEFPAGAPAAWFWVLTMPLWVAAGIAVGAACQIAVLRRDRLPLAAVRGLLAGLMGSLLAIGGLSLAAALDMAAHPSARPTIATVALAAGGWLAHWPASATGSLMGGDGGWTAPVAWLIVLAAGLAASFFLLPAAALEIIVFVASLTALTSLAVVGSRAFSPAELSAAASRLPWLFAAAALAGLLGPWLSAAPGGGWLARWLPLQLIGDRLPAPVASPVGSDPRLRQRWRRLATIGAGLLAVQMILLLIPPATPAASLGRQAGGNPSALELVAGRYLAATAHGDAPAAWAEMVVDQPAAEPNAVRLVDLNALAAMFASQTARPPAPASLRLVSRRPAGSDVAAEFRAGPGAERRPALILRSTAAGWKVVVRAGIAEIGLAQPAGLTFDGIPIAGGQPLLVIALPGSHLISAGDGRLLRAENASLLVGSGAVARLQLSPAFTSEALAAAAKLARAALAACAGYTSPAPAGCPQAAAIPAPVTWRPIGEPGPETITLSGTPEKGISATGRYQYIGAYRVHVPEGIAHLAATGAYRLPLTWTESGFSGSGAVQALPNQPAVRPTVDEAAFHGAVANGLLACAGSSLLRPPDCPNGLASSRFVTPVTWRLLSDGTAQGALDFDSATGQFVVTGTFRMSATYTEGGQPKTGISSGRFQAILLWDGTAPMLVSIRSI